MRIFLAYCAYSKEAIYEGEDYVHQDDNYYTLAAWKELNNIIDDLEF